MTATLDRWLAYSVAVGRITYARALLIRAGVLVDERMN